MRNRNVMDPPKDLDRANTIIFDNKEQKIPRLVLDKGLVSCFIKEMTFKEKSPCFCYHRNGFQLNQDNLAILTVEYCDHCLNVIDYTYEKCPTCNHIEKKTVISWYKMPTKLYEMIQEILGEEK